MAQREPCSPYSRHYSANLVTLSLEMVERAGLHMMRGKVSIKWLAWVVVEELSSRASPCPVPVQHQLDELHLSVLLFAEWR